MYNDSRTTELNMPTTNGVVLFELKAPYTPRLNEVTFRNGDGNNYYNNMQANPNVGINSNPNRTVLTKAQKANLALFTSDKLREGLYPQRDPIWVISPERTYIHPQSNPRDLIRLELHHYWDKQGTYHQLTVPFDHALTQAANMFNIINRALYYINNKSKSLNQVEENCVNDLKQEVLNFGQSIQTLKNLYGDIQTLKNLYGEQAIDKSNMDAYETAAALMEEKIADLKEFVSSNQKLICEMKRHAASNDKAHYWLLWDRAFHLTCREADCCCVQ